MGEFLAGAVVAVVVLYVAGKWRQRREARALGARMVHVFVVPRETHRPGAWDVQ